MNRRLLWGLVIMGALVAMAGCVSTDDFSHVPCTCGSVEADLHGCHCAQCASGEGNPQNPHCTCGALHVKPAPSEK